ncbi:MAG: endolytic transglycosylase MltG [Spirochaetales bacterium]|nr:endolytic transglycosylase MltG [Spirochaetales bacterium]
MLRIGGRPTDIVVPVGGKYSTFCKNLESAGVTRCEYLEEAGKSPRFLSSFALLQEKLGSVSLEGLLLPGSYRVRLKFLDSSCETCDPEPVLRHNAEAFLRAVLPVTLKRLRPLEERHGLSVYQQIILASIVEKEAVANQDYDRVAAVFLRRLRRNMPLGSCPAVEYALGFHRPFLLFRDIRIRSPYNLYVKKGLPPGPIAFFSDQALQGVLYPADSDDLFFVYDWTLQKLLFASHYSLHEKNAEQARKNYIQKFGRKNLYRADYDRFYK